MATNADLGANLGMRERIVTSSSLSDMPGGDQRPIVIDEAHLRQITLGDASLEREVLEIFVRQAQLLLERITGAGPAIAAASAHTLKGSARGIGAWQVVSATERLERALAHGEDEAPTAAVAGLKHAILEACAAIGARLGQGQEAAGEHEHGH